VQYDRPWDQEPPSRHDAPAPAQESGCARH
jgi:hypothetical protein